MDQNKATPIRSRASRAISDLVMAELFIVQATIESAQALGDGLRVVELRVVGADPENRGHPVGQPRAPVDVGHPALEVGEVGRAERRDPDHHPGRRPQPDVGAVQEPGVGFELDDSGAARFFHNGDPLGDIPDEEFGAQFLAIWLSPDTSRPELRAQLIGQAD